MDDWQFRELLESVKEAVAIAKDEKKPSRIFQVKPEDDVENVREERENQEFPTMRFHP